jgi:hypothetical protein
MVKRIKKVSAAVMLWSAVFVGCFIGATALADLYMLAKGSEPGTPIYLDELAPTEQEALLQLGYGAALVVLPFLMRRLLRRRTK